MSAKTAHKNPARAVADLAEGTIIATVEIGAPPELVYRALTDPNELVQWWGSEDMYKTTRWTSELRVGGRWRSEGRGADGSEFSVEGEYLELDPPRKIVHTWKPDWDGGNVTTVTYRVEPIADGSRVTVRHTGFAGRSEACGQHAQGWERVLDWMSAFAAPLTPPKLFFCRLHGPRPTFMIDMNADERALMGTHVAYWRQRLAEGRAVIFGPVADPEGGWGLGVVRAEDEVGAKQLLANDPVILAGRGFRYDTFAMPSAIL